MCVCPHDSTPVFTLHCCITAAFQHVTTLLLLCLTRKWISQYYNSKIRWSWPHMCDSSNRALSQVLELHVPVFSPSLLPLICLCTDKCVCSSSLTAKLFFWISNLSNQSRWRRSKAWGSVRRGTARTLLRWPFMSMAAGQLPPVFPTETPPSPPCTLTRLQTVTTTFSYHVLL